ncbi:MAG: hypothetical protein ACYCZZ_02005 [Minisyncoccota bacterium]
MTPQQQAAVYIRSELARGIDHTAITKNLIAQGWQTQDINAAFGLVSPDQQSPDLQTPTTQPLPTAIIPKKRHPARKTILWVAGTIFFLALLLILTPSVLGIIYRDGPAPDDSDLQLATVSIPDNQNAYFDLQSAVQQEQTALSATSSDIQKRTASSLMLAALASAATKTSYQDPAAADPSKVSFNSILPSLNGYRQVFKINGTYARKLAESGHADQALVQAELGVSVGQKMVESQAFLIEWLIGIAIKEDALQAVREIATSTLVSPKELVAAATAFGNYSSAEPGLINAFKISYLANFKWTIENLTYGNLNELNAIEGSGLPKISPIASTLNTTNFYWHPNDSLDYGINDSRQKIVMAKESCATFQDTHEPQKFSLPTNFLLELMTQNLVGKIIYNLLSASLDTAKFKQCDDSMYIGATQLVLALEAYKQDHKTLLPPSLNDLVPSYLSVLPTDPYSGKSFHYDSTRHIIYSVGQGHIDTGGSSSANPSFSL